MIELILNTDNELAILIPLSNLDFKYAELIQHNGQVGIRIVTNMKEPIVIGTLEEMHIASATEKGFMYVFEGMQNRIIRNTKLNFKQNSVI